MSNNTTSGINVLGLLGIVFVVLKLLGKITWSWWWVTCPFWGVFALILAALVCYGVYLLAAASIAGIKGK